MPFDARIVEAQISLDLIASSDMPQIAWDALEAGLDGKYIRRLAALESPTYFQVVQVLPVAMQEMGMTKLGKGTAAPTLAKARAKEILESGANLLKQAKYFERLWIEAGYPKELRSVGYLDDEIYIDNSPEPQIRKWVIERLQELIRS